LKCANLDPSVLSWLGCIDGSLDQRQAFADDVPFHRRQNKYGNSPNREVLFVRDGLVSGEEHVETVPLRGCQEFPVLQTRPTLIADSEYLMSAQRIP